jgi:hypothetical protein
MLILFSQVITQAKAHKRKEPHMPEDQSTRFDESPTAERASFRWHGGLAALLTFD